MHTKDCRWSLSPTLANCLDACLHQDVGEQELEGD